MAARGGRRGGAARGNRAVLAAADASVIFVAAVGARVMSSYFISVFSYFSQRTSPPTRVSPAQVP